MKVAPSGFTLIELLVVVSLVVILTTIGTFSVINVLNEADIKAEQANIDQLRIALSVYKEATGQYPPSPFNTPTDNCSICILRAGTILAAQTEWDLVVDVLVPQYMSTSIETDTWGNPYGYDNNLNISASDDNYYTVLCSMGPDGVLQTYLTANLSNYLKSVTNPTALGDDICFFTY